MGGLLLGVFGLLVLAAVPVGFALAIAAVIAIVVADLPLVVIPQQIVAGMDSFPMLAVPLFILAGYLMDVGGISRRLVALARARTDQACRAFEWLSREVERGARNAGTPLTSL